MRLSFVCVEDAITKVLPQISRARAYEIALHAHTHNSATVMLTWEEKAKEVALGEADKIRSNLGLYLGKRLTLQLYV